MWWNTIKEFFTSENGRIFNYIIDAILALLFLALVVWFAIKSRHFFAVIVPIIFMLLFYFLAIEFNLKFSSVIYHYACYVIPLFMVIVLAPDIHNWFEVGFKKNQGTRYVKGNDDNKQAIADAVLYLSSRKIGALITIEKHKLLDQYAEKAIVMNADISKELLINIFSPLTPLHDGAVIIKGNKIRCAGAYYVLSTRETLDKTVGSRHRAALGIAEVTDSITIVVSEETGKISITYSGIIITITDRDKLLEYIDLAME